MEPWRRLQVEIPAATFDALREDAQRERRSVREHAGYLLERLLTGPGPSDARIPAPAGDRTERLAS
jgi:hypothetical protein